MTGKVLDPLDFHQNALNMRAYRQQVLASNIANADTPNYKARDFDFRQALSGAVAGRNGLPLARTESGHIKNGISTAADAFLQYRQEVQGSVDGNSVDLDVERAKFAENALQYQASITFINGLIRSMNTAITSQ